MPRAKQVEPDDDDFIPMPSDHQARLAAEHELSVLQMAVEFCVAGGFLRREKFDEAVEFVRKFMAT